MAEDLDVLAAKLALCDAIDKARTEALRLPPSREVSLVRTKLDEAGMWALRVGTDEAGRLSDW
jgi:hypothetical protein